MIPRMLTLKYTNSIWETYFDRDLGLAGNCKVVYTHNNQSVTALRSSKSALLEAQIV